MLKFFIFLFIGVNLVYSSCFATIATQTKYMSRIRAHYSNNTLEDLALLASLPPDQDIKFVVKHPQSGEILQVSVFNNFELGSDHYYYYQGKRLQGYELDLMSDSCKIVDIKALDDVMPAKATSIITLSATLDRNVANITSPFNPQDANSYNLHLGINFHDGEGNEYKGLIYFAKESDLYWNAYLIVQEKNLAHGYLQFNQDGNYLSATGFDAINFANKNGKMQNFRVDLSHLTTKLKSHTGYRIDDDGHSIGHPFSDYVDAEGYLIQLYDNGYSTKKYKLAILNH